MDIYERPDGFTNEKRDCTVRALSIAANIPYEKAHEGWKKVGRKSGHGIVAKKYFQLVCKLLNIEATQVKRSGSLNKFLNQFPKGRYYCLKRRHAFAVVDGVAHDTDVRNPQIKGAWLLTIK